MAEKDREKQREYHREGMREFREYRKWRHLCVDCGTQDAYTMVGRTRCADCAEKHNAGSRKSWAESSEVREKKAAAKKAFLAYRRENRLCTVCGDQLPPPPYSFVTCPSCRAENRRRLEEKRREKGVIPAALYPLWSLCTICGQPRMEGTTAWGGEPIKLCQRCYENTVKAGEAGRAAYLLKYGETYGETVEGRAKRLRDARKEGKHEAI